MFACRHPDPLTALAS